MRVLMTSLVVAGCIGLPTWAHAVSSSVSSTTSTVGTGSSRVNPDVVVTVPPQVIWGNGNGTAQQNATHCIRCCIYQNQSYSEGAVVKAEGVLLQCAEDKQRLSTNNLVWRIVKQ